MLFFEVTVVKSLEGFAVTGFVARHFVNGVVNCVKVLLFRHARKFGFACGCAGSTETIFYTLALYCGSVGISKTRHALPAALAGCTAGVVSGILLVRIM